MTSKRQLLRVQREWAKSMGLRPDERGYLENFVQNLCQPLSTGAKCAFEDGSGAELQDRGKVPAKMRALHSSAALAVNFFDHWTERDARPLLHALEIEPVLPVALSFETQFPTGLPGNPPNLDVALTLASGAIVGIESKFTEWLTPKGNKGLFKAKYFDGGVELWGRLGLSRCQELVADLVSGTETYRFLDVAQLLKHVLGLSMHGAPAFSLYYLYFDVPCPASELHRKELSHFAKRVDLDVNFKVITYQHLYSALAARSDVDPEYLSYLGLRYFA